MYQLLTSCLFSGLKVVCKANEFSVFNPPSGQTCGAWANEFVKGLGGYLDNANDTIACRYCQYSVGDDFYTPLQLAFDDRWRDCFVILAFVGEFLHVLCSTRRDPDSCSLTSFQFPCCGSGLQVYALREALELFQNHFIPTII